MLHIPLCVLMSCKHWSIADEVFFQIKFNFKFENVAKNRFMCQLSFHTDMKPFRSLMSTKEATIASSYVFEHLL